MRNEEENGDEDLDVLDDRDMDNNAVDGPTVLAHVELCRTVHKYTIVLLGFDLYFFVTDRQLPIADLAMEINQPRLIEHVRRFLYDQLYPDSDLPSSDISLNASPTFLGKVSIFLSAIATYYAPSDPCGFGGMHHEYIWATSSWQQGPAHYDCVLVNSCPELEGMHGLDVIRVLLLFSFPFNGMTYPCAFVCWFSIIDEEHDEDTGMWMVQPAVTEDGLPEGSIIHLDCIFRAAHVLPIYGDTQIRDNVLHRNLLDAFVGFYVNKYADHHAFEIVY